MKTKIVFILLGLGLACGSAYAAYGDETPMPMSNDINVTAPHQGGTWSFGAEAVLMQPTNQAFTYAELYTTTVTLQAASHDSYEDVNQSYHWWFGADISYGFAGNGRDVTLAYEGLQGNDTAHSSATNTDTTFLGAVPGGDGDFTAASGETQTHYDAADLLFGQKLDVGERISLHPFVGVRYAYINEQNTGNYSGPTTLGDGPADNGTGIQQQVWKSTFNGIGPRFGSDAAINLGQGFSVRGRLGLSALIGSIKPDYNTTYQIYLNSTGDFVFADDYVNNQASSTHLIPEIDGRLGLNYTHNFDANMALGVEAGWQATNYFNVIYQLSGVGEDLTQNAMNNFGLQGPYARLQLDIA